MKNRRLKELDDLVVGELLLAHWALLAWKLVQALNFIKNKFFLTI